MYIGIVGFGVLLRAPNMRTFDDLILSLLRATTQYRICNSPRTFQCFCVIGSERFKLALQAFCLVRPKVALFQEIRKISVLFLGKRARESI